MTAKVLASFGGKFAEQWVTTLLTPAFMFWLGGFVAVVQALGWDAIVTQFTQYPEPLQITLLIIGFFVVTASAFVVQRFDLAAIRFLEGYWPSWLYFLQQAGIRHYRNRKNWLSQQSNKLRNIEERQKVRRQTLKTTIETKGVDRLTLAERDEYLKLVEQILTPIQQSNLIQWRQELRELPANTDLLPTRLGNVLRAAERQPLNKYGLDAIICWPRLWLLLPDGVKKELQDARSDLNSAARVWLWSLLFILWSFAGAWWATPLGLLSAFFVYYYWAIGAARAYGLLIEAVFDLYRHLLYQSLRWHLPPEPQIEKRVGAELTEYLRRGS